jgi:hypothetical protein
LLAFPQVAENPVDQDEPTAFEPVPPMAMILEVVDAPSRVVAASALQRVANITTIAENDRLHCSGVAERPVRCRSIPLP